MKKRTVLLFAAALLLFSSCGSNQTGIDLKYSIDGMEVSVQSINSRRVKGDNSGMSASWKDVSEFTISEECDLIVRASIAKLEEYSISYDTKTDLHVTNYGTVLTAVVNEVYLGDASLKEAQITINNEYVESNRPAGARSIAVGEEYYFFLRKTEGHPENMLGYERFVEYFIVLPPIDDYLLSADEPVSKPMLKLLQYNAKSALPVSEDMDELLRAAIGK